MKRVFDIVLVLATMPFWLPILDACAIAVLVFDGRPVLFFQDRTGLGGRIFRMAKLRTMRPGAGTDRGRTTRLGAFLRATSLDELPQLFHVLMGDMSLVGPRPLPAVYLPRYCGDESRRHEVRPGITGWAQVNGRNAISWEEKFALDVWYVDHRSLFLDVKILFKTFFGVLARSGVNSGAETTMPELRPELGARRRKDRAYYSNGVGQCVRNYGTIINNPQLEVLRQERKAFKSNETQS